MGWIGYKLSDNSIKAIKKEIEHRFASDTPDSCITLLDVSHRGRVHYLLLKKEHQFSGRLSKKQRKITMVILFYLQDILRYINRRPKKKG